MEVEMNIVMVYGLSGPCEPPEGLRVEHEPGFFIVVMKP